MSTTTIADLREQHQQFTDAIWNRGELDRLDDLFTEDVLVHEMGEGKAYEGLDEVREWVEDVRTGFPDFEVEIRDFVATEEKLVTQWVARGTHEGELRSLDVEPTHETVEFEGVTIYETDGERIAEAWWYYDMLGIVTQMGLVPEAFEA